MGNTINTILCDREQSTESPKNVENYPPFEPMPMRYPSYYRGRNRPFIH